MQIDVFTIFPNLIDNFASESLLGRARRKNLLKINSHDLRAGATDVHRSVDDSPFGGGPGMVLAPGPVFNVVNAVEPPRPLIFLSPGGHKFDQSRAQELAQLEGFSLLCGRYEGLDQRVIDNLCDDELSVGDVVLAGGEVAALVVIEAVTRLLPGVMGNNQSADSESFSTDLLEYPQYTRPSDFEGLQVPEVLQSGNHAHIEKWRYAAALARTLKMRPDLIEKRGGITKDEQDLLVSEGFVHLPPKDVVEL